jgi:hypothetical protein
MRREAVLLANTAKTNDPRTSVSSSLAKSSIAQFRERLSNLGDYAFNCVSVVDEPQAKTVADIGAAVKNAAKNLVGDKDEGSCFLFYYFGHGVLRQNDLYFYCKDSDTAAPLSMIPFAQVAAQVFGYGIKRALFVLDCCHAGASAYKLPTLVTTGVDYAIVASSVPAQLAEVKPGLVPFGAFSMYFLGGLRDVDAAVPPNKLVTVESLFTYTKDLLRAEGYRQEPYKIDGGLNDLPLSEAAAQVRIIPGYNGDAARKSFYSKMSWIAATVADSSVPLTMAALYSIVKRKRVPEFLTPITTKGTTKYQPVSPSTFESYIDRMKTLRILHDDEPLTLTPQGRKLVAHGGRRFNEELLPLIESEFERWDTSIDKVDSLVRYKAQTRGVPTAAALYLDARRALTLTMKPDWFATLLDLLSYTGYVRAASRKTFFPY